MVKFTGTHQLATAICEALGLKATNVGSLTLKFHPSAIVTVEALLYPDVEPIEASDFVAQLRHFQLVPKDEPAAAFPELDIEEVPDGETVRIRR